MKKLIKRFLLFVVIFLVVATITDVIISSQAKKVISTDNSVWNDIYEHKVLDPCLIYGSSRATTHIDPMMVESLTGISTYNFGMPGQTFDIQHLRHTINLENNSPPQYIIYSLDAFTLCEATYIDNFPQMFPYMFGNKNLMDKIKKYYDKPHYFLDFFVPLFRYHEYSYIIHKSVLNIFEKKSHSPKGYLKNNGKWNEETSVPQLGKTPRIEIDPMTIQRFEGFIEECNKNNIKLALIYTPEYHSVKQFIPNRDSIINVYNNLAMKNNIPFIDYTKDSICADTTYFNDPLHLNAKGSIIITEQTINKLKNVGFFEKPTN